MDLKYQELLNEWLPFLFIRLKNFQKRKLTSISEILEYLKDKDLQFSLFYKNVSIGFKNRNSTKINIIEKTIYYITESIVYNPNYKEWYLPSGDLVTNEYTYIDGVNMIKNGILQSDRLNDLSKLGNHCKAIGCNKIGSKFLVTISKNGAIHIDLYDQYNMLMNIDHIHPKSKGGVNHISNYQLMCQECNSKKGNYVAERKILKFDMFLESKNNNILDTLILDLYEYAKNNNVIVNIKKYDNNTLNLYTIDSFEAGSGTKFMKYFTKLADGNKLNITLIPAESKTRSRTWLIKWYEQFGFVKDNTDKYLYLIRYPKNNI